MQPQMPDDTIKSGKQLAEFASDLLDSEVQMVAKIVGAAARKYGRRQNTVKNLEEMRDEVLTKLAENNILATIDPSPCFHGEPPVVEIIGKIATDPIHKEGMDHEQKGYEVKKATKRGEDYLGQNERVNTRVPKDRSSGS